MPAEGLGFHLELRQCGPEPRARSTRRYRQRGRRELSGTARLAREHFGDWDFDTAFLASAAETLDRTDNRFSLTEAFAAGRSREPRAQSTIWNGGGDYIDNAVDTSLNGAGNLDSAYVSVDRFARTRLTLADFKVSNASLFELPAGESRFRGRHRISGVRPTKTIAIPRLDGTTDVLQPDTQYRMYRGTSQGPATRPIPSAKRSVYLRVRGGGVAVWLHPTWIRAAGRKPGPAARGAV